MNRIVVWLYDFLKGKKTVFYLILLSLFLVLGYFASCIKLEEDITKMIPDDKQTVDYKTTIKNIKILDKIIVSITSDKQGMEDSLISCAEFFVQRLKNKTEGTNLISDIRYKVEGDKMEGIYNLLYNNIPAYLTPEDYKRIDSIISDSSIKVSIESDYHKLVSPASSILKRFILKDPLSITASALNKLQGMQAEENYVLHDGYIFRKNKNTLVLFITPVHTPNETHINAELIDQINETSQQSEQIYHATSINYFGAAAVAVANARQIEKDIKIIASVALFLILLFLYLFYRSWVLPILMISPIVFGVLFSLSCIYFIQGTISAIAIGAGAVIIGIGLDYSFHVFAHYQHTGSIKEVVNDIATPMLIGSVSTVGAFFSLLYVHSDILSDFGLFAGLCLIGASLFSLVFLPHLIELFHSAKTSVHLINERKTESFIIKFITINPEKNKWIVGIVLLMTAVFIYFSGRVEFDSDLSQINFMSEKLKKAENSLYENDTSRGKSIFLIFKGKNLTEALSRNESALSIIDSLQKSDIVHRYAGISGLLPSDSIQLERIHYWERYWTSDKIERIKNCINTYSVQLGFRPDAFDEFYQMLDKKYSVMNKDDQNFMKQVFLKEYIQEDSNGVAVLASMRLPTDISNDVYKPFEIIPGLTILDRQLFYNKFLLIVKEDFNQILLSSSLLVFCILLLSYGRIELSLISFLPMVISWFWILGIMGIFNIHFNIVNIIISTFVFGLGDDYSIFFTDGLQKKYAEGKDNLSSYKVSVFLSAFTTIVAMGALIFARHPALKSIALISIIGIGCVVVISYTLIPLLFKLIISNRISKGLHPLTISGFIRSISIHIYISAGIVFLTAIGSVLFVLSKLIKIKQIQFFFHWLLMYAVRSLFFILFFIKKRITRTTEEKISTPCIIITNEQTFLNIGFILTLNPKIIFLKNDSSEVLLPFRPLLNLIGLFGSQNKFNTKQEYISYCLSQGYSVVISLANEDSSNDDVLNQVMSAVQKHQSTILPIVIAGAENCIQKNDFLINKAAIYVNILSRIEYHTLGTPSERICNLKQLLEREYSLLKNSISITDFYYQILFSYIFKGPILEWYFRIKVKMEESYKQFDELIPMSGKIYDLGCGYGFLDYFLFIKSDQRRIIGVDYDANKIAVASHSYLKNQSIEFIENDIMNVDIISADTVLLLDVLHYLPEQSQEALIRKAFNGLNQGGKLIIRDGDCSKKSRHNGTMLTEFFSTRVLMFNKKTEHHLCFISSEAIIKILQGFNLEVKVVDNTRYTSNTLYYIIKK